MTKTATKTYLVGVIERAIAYYKVEAEDARAAAENWDEGEFHDRDDEALESEGPCSVREQQPDGSCLTIPPSEWEDEPTSRPPPRLTATSFAQLVRAEPDYWSNGLGAARVSTCRSAANGEQILFRPAALPRLRQRHRHETYYAFVEAPNALAAVAVAQRQAATAQTVDIDDPLDFQPLLVTAGHHGSQPLFNK